MEADRGVSIADGPQAFLPSIFYSIGYLGGPRKVVLLRSHSVRRAFRLSRRRNPRSISSPSVRNKRWTVVLPRCLSTIFTISFHGINVSWSLRAYGERYQMWKPRSENAMASAFSPPVRSRAARGTPAKTEVQARATPLSNRNE